jgi:hypothetical protein
MLKKTLALAILSGMSFAASAVTVDLRHEYIDSGSNADRVAVSHRFDNGLGFGVEAKWKTGGDTDKQDRPFNEIVGNGHEESINWRWKATDNIALTQALILKVKIAPPFTNRICMRNTALITASMWLLAIVMNIPAYRRLRATAVVWTIK